MKIGHEVPSPLTIVVCRGFWPQWPPSQLSLHHGSCFKGVIASPPSTLCFRSSLSPFTLSISYECSSSSPLILRSRSIVCRRKDPFLANSNRNTKGNQQKKGNQNWKGNKKRKRNKKRKNDTAAGEEEQQLGSIGRATHEQIFIDLNEMPLNHIRDFVINNVFLGFELQFKEIIEWFRNMCGMDGFSLCGIPSARCLVSYPVFQINVIFGEFRTSLLFAKDNAYQQGYKRKGEWYLFVDSEYIFDGAKSAQVNGKYTTKFSLKIGPVPLMNTLQTICNCENDFARGEVRDLLFVLFPESARNPAIEQQVLDAFDSVSDGMEFDDNPNPNELVENPLLASPLFDIFDLTRAKYPINNFITVSLKDPLLFSMKNGEQKYFCPLPYAIKNWKKLSFYWWVYCLSDGKYFFLDDVTIYTLGIVNARSLRSVLGLLCHWDLDNILLECKSKIGKFSFTEEHYKLVESNVERLKLEEQRRRKGEWKAITVFVK